MFCFCISLATIRVLCYLVVQLCCSQLPNDTCDLSAINYWCMYLFVNTDTVCHRLRWLIAVFCFLFFWLHGAIQIFHNNNYYYVWISQPVAGVFVMSSLEPCPIAQERSLISSSYRLYLPFWVCVLFQGVQPFERNSTLIVVPAFFRFLSRPAVTVTRALTIIGITFVFTFHNLLCSSTIDY